MELTPADQKLANFNKITIGADPEPIGLDPDYLVPKSGGEYQIPLQFPVKITGDGKSTNWQMTDAASYEPIAVYEGSNARYLTLEFTYVVFDDDSQSYTKGGVKTTQWTPQKIMAVERTIKSYFYRKAEKSINKTPVVYIYDLYTAVMAGFERASFRAKSMDIQRSHALIPLREFGFGPRAVNLVTTITLELESYTQLAGRLARGGDGSDEDKKIPQQNLSSAAEAAWY